MAKLLHIEASPRGAESFSSRAAAAFVDEYRRSHPQDEIEQLRLFEHALPDFDAEAAAQKMQHIAQLMRGEQGVEPVGKWAGVVAEIERLKAADKVLISTPMWNFSLPYRLKHYLDVILQPGLTFYVNRQGEYVGKLRGKPLQLIIASGSAYAPGFPRADGGTKTDFLQAYLLHVGRWLGFEDIRVIRIQPTAHPVPGEVDALMQGGIEEARAAARSF
ncbi:MAG: NAD(P)H-dependent oxidoreductase [Gammaproteobacteria bacterium]|nr:MAG: NAD(P)H-dependent oxidoreductase [Gammaproteobacteria bacterium]